MKVAYIRNSKLLSLIVFRSVLASFRLGFGTITVQDHGVTLEVSSGMRIRLEVHSGSFDERPATWNSVESPLGVLLSFKTRFRSLFLLHHLLLLHLRRNGGLFQKVAISKPTDGPIVLVSCADL